MGTLSCFSGCFTEGHCFYDFLLASFDDKLYKMESILKCLSIGTPKAINFPFVSNEKLMFF